MTDERARQAELYLVGMVCYYGKHYSTFFFQTKIRKWMYFDDAHVKEVRRGSSSFVFWYTAARAGRLLPPLSCACGRHRHS